MLLLYVNRWISYIHLTNLKSIGAALLNLMPASRNLITGYFLYCNLLHPFAVIQILGALLSVVRMGSSPWNICFPADFLLAWKNNFEDNTFINLTLIRNLSISPWVNSTGFNPEYPDLLSNTAS